MDSIETTTETTETTTVASTETAPAAAPRPRLTLALTATGELPSQAGKAGRPRGRGRATIRMADGSEVNVAQAREALAELLEIRLSEVTQYKYKAPEGAVVFIAQRIGADEAREYVASPA